MVFRFFASVLLVTCVAVAQEQPADPSERSAEPEVLWHEAKALMPTRVIFPPDFDGERATDLVVALHGYGSSAEAFGRVGRTLAEAGLMVALPESPYALIIDGKLGYDWFLYHRGDDALQLQAATLAAVDHLPRVVADLRRRYRIDRVYILGFSQGAIMAVITGPYHNGLFDGIISFGLPAFDTAWFQDNTLSTASDLRILLIHGDEDERAPVAMSRRARDTFQAAGYDVTFRSFAGGHSVPAAELAFVTEWVAPQRSRRGTQTPDAGD